MEEAQRQTVQIFPIAISPVDDDKNPLREIHFVNDLIESFDKLSDERLHAILTNGSCLHEPCWHYILFATTFCCYVHLTKYLCKNNHTSPLNLMLWLFTNLKSLFVLQHFGSWRKERGGYTSLLVVNTYRCYQCKHRKYRFDL